MDVPGYFQAGMGPGCWPTPRHGSAAGGKEAEGLSLASVGALVSALSPGSAGESGDLPGWSTVRGLAWLHGWGAQRALGHVGYKHPAQPWPGHCSSVVPRCLPICTQKREQALSRLFITVGNMRCFLQAQKRTILPSFCPSLPLRLLVMQPSPRFLVRNAE